MDFISTLKKIESSDLFKDFIKKHPKAELVAGFFIIDFETHIDQKSLDYMLGEVIFTFSIDESDEVTLKEDKLIDDPRFPPLKKISKKIKFDLDKIPSLAEEAALKNKIGQKFQKIIAVLQKHEAKSAWNLTCILGGFSILNILIDADTGKVLKFDTKNLGDFIQKR
jgi:hypothetical protein